mgnify:CR=1 FL=1
MWPKWRVAETSVTRLNYHPMPDELSWETLKSRRIKLQLTNLYKIQHNLIDVEVSKYLTKWSTTVGSKHSSQLNLYQPSSSLASS